MISHNKKKSLYTSANTLCLCEIHFTQDAEKIHQRTQRVQHPLHSLRLCVKTSSCIAASQKYVALYQTERMIIRYTTLFLSFLLWTNFIVAQNDKDYTWWNPATNAFPTIEGQAWPGTVKNFYDRLPAKAEQQVRKDVWNLSRHSAGLYIKFNSDAKDIVVRYTAINRDNYAMPHMPATGVSVLTSMPLTIVASGCGARKIFIW